MFGQCVRMVVAILTFTTGIALVRVLELIPRLETALVDRVFTVNETDLAPVALCDPAQDADEIYDLVIQKKFAPFDREVKLIVLRAEPAGFPLYGKGWDLAETFQQVMEVIPEAQPQTIDNYLARNSSSERMRVSSLVIYYVLVPNSDLLIDGVEAWWTRFYEKSPNSSGLIFFSNIGFNVQRDQAFLYVGRSCRGLYMPGAYVLLSKVNGKWEIRKESGLWGTT